MTPSQPSAAMALARKLCAQEARGRGADTLLPDVSLVFRWWIGPQERPPVRGPSHCCCSEALFLERTTGFEPATPTLARWCSTAEPRPREPCESRLPGRGASTVPYRVPVDPNPPSPRLEGEI